ncbi:molybdate transport system substrate-binding protein [Devosia enhydra]|uniref:Molybdate transport system substrate-binding protein n=1 Tax=Devosia enhydra TaxID=665118 RepID=A0A1K2I2M1_9HYPH|nr:molybdate ABC transporter substrate-binding protein [Devosia enhydra]SFZ86629.1 molybdate transport system substrate-binding protein [Devosia enhydra]
MIRALGLALLCGIASVASAQAETVNVAVAANFTAVAEELAALFKAETGHDAVLSFGATGQLYTQITQGAPFGVFLSADDVRPTQAVTEGHGVDGSVFTYAIGQLALFSTSLDLADGEAVLRAGAYEKIAIADPAAAPYGAAAIEALTALDLRAAIEPKFVTGANITQTLQFVDTGNAELGFVAASQVAGRDSVWIVPADLHAPIRQDAVLLRSAANNPAAAAFIDFLKSDAARERIAAAGYSVE